jgi:hypothetical protein
LAPLEIEKEKRKRKEKKRKEKANRPHLSPEANNKSINQ